MKAIVAIQNQGFKVQEIFSLNLSQKLALILKP